ncbi:MAG: pyruvate kinase [Terriglobia bacterium]
MMSSRTRKTKIVATIGPASSSEEKLRELMLAGVNIFRLNMSHGNHEGHGEAIRSIRKITSELALPIGILIDLQGPKIRLGSMEGDQPVMLSARQEFVLTTESVAGNSSMASISYPLLPKEVKPGDRILVDDGLVELEVTSVSDHRIKTKVLFDGTLKSHKGVNFPDSPLSIPAVTEKDVRDLQFALAHEADFVALSFVRSAADILDAKSKMAELSQNKGGIPLIAKIEKPQAVDDIEAILKVADGIMVARGDLGVEMATERVPMLQKNLIAACLKMAKPVITATQMLESMTHAPRPTRAEASDVANAILDGTDAVMLSAETATGQFPVESVKTMERIICFTEDSAKSLARFDERRGSANFLPTFSHSACHAAMIAANQLGVSKILVFTETGATAGILASLRPDQLILAFTPHAVIYRRLSLLRGVVPVRMEHVSNPAKMIEEAEKILLAQGLAAAEETIIIVAGVLQVSGATNMMKIHRVGEMQK